MQMNKHAGDKTMHFLQFIFILHIFANMHYIYLNVIEAGHENANFYANLLTCGVNVCFNADMCIFINVHCISLA